MESALRLLFDVLKFLWPFRPVDAWERGFYYVFGRARRPVGPGFWPVVPYFMDVRATSVAPAVIGTPLLTITLRDGRTLMFSASATVIVEDPKLAICSVDQYQETILELVSAVTAEKLAEVDASRLEPDARRRLMADLRRWLDDETRKFGVRVTALRFPNFAINIRAYRLLTDTALAAKSNW